MLILLTSQQLYRIQKLFLEKCCGLVKNKPLSLFFLYLQLFLACFVFRLFYNPVYVFFHRALPQPTATQIERLLRKHLLLSLIHI